MQAALAAAAADYECHTKDAQKATTAPSKKLPTTEALDLDPATGDATETYAGGSGKRKVNPACLPPINSLAFPHNGHMLDMFQSGSQQC